MYILEDQSPSSSMQSSHKTLPNILIKLSENLITLYIYVHRVKQQQKIVNKYKQKWKKLLNKSYLLGRNSKI